MEFLTWLSQDKNWVYTIATLVILGFVIEGILRAARGKD